LKKQQNGKRRIFLAILILIFVLMFGVAGFKLLGGKEWSFLDSLYMTVITLSTVGYREVVDPTGNPSIRIFTVVFILLCLGTIAFAVSSITAFIVEGELKNVLWRRKMEKIISKLDKHYIVCGSDETAQTIVQELILTHKKFVAIDPLKQGVDKLSALGDVLFIQGDPTDDQILISAGIKKAKGILLSLPTDEENLFLTLSARSLNPDIRIVTKGIYVKSYDKMIKAGANSVINPPYIGGMRMVSEMVRPTVVTFLDMMLREREKVLRFEEVPVRKTSSLVGKSVGESNIRKNMGALLVAIKNADTREYHFNPSAETVIQEKDILILIASPEMVKKVEKIAGSKD